MKYHLTFLGLLFLITILSACSDKEKNDVSEQQFRERKENIIGTWNNNETYERLKADGTQLNATKLQFPITFKSDGTGTYANPFYNPDTTPQMPANIHFEWFYQLSPEQIMIHVTQGGFLGEEIRIFNTHTNTSNSQHWKSERIKEAFPLNSTNYRVYTWNLKN